jgi:hypothetical protein
MKLENYITSKKWRIANCEVQRVWKRPVIGRKVSYCAHVQMHQTWKTTSCDIVCSPIRKVNVITAVMTQNIILCGRSWVRVVTATYLLLVTRKWFFFQKPATSSPCNELLRLLCLQINNLTDNSAVHNLLQSLLLNCERISYFYRTPSSWPNTQSLTIAPYLEPVQSSTQLHTLLL